MSSYDEIPDELIEFVEVKINGYFVKKGSVDGGTIFGKFNSLKEACAAACILYRNNWRLMDVVIDPLVGYGNEFWVFKVEKNKLVLDNKFEDYESAVEYMEINLRCNDYHNDVFRDSLKKRGHKDRYNSSNNDDYVGQEKYIFEKGDKFIVKKSKNADLVYGEFDSYNEASAAKKLLVDSKWKISNEHEIVYNENSYWVFDVNDGILTFKGKSESYDDALDFITPPNIQNETENPFITAADENIDEVIKRSKLKSKMNSTKKSSRKSSKPSQNSNIKKSVDIERIWDPKIETKKLKNKHVQILVERCGDNVNDLFSILDFTFSSDNHIKCIVDGNEIEWNKRNNVTISNFPEFKLIINILEINKWDLLKIKNSSSIYFYNDFYYKIHVVDNKILFGKFASYGVAENTLLIYKGRPILPIDYNSLGIDNFGDYYELMKFQNGEVYKTMHLKSLEEVKVIRDILMHENWDFSIFRKYDLFYLNGLYWELQLNNHLIFMKGKYELIEIKKSI